MVKDAFHSFFERLFGYYVGGGGVVVKKVTCCAACGQKRKIHGQK